MKLNASHILIPLLWVKVGAVVSVAILSVGIYFGNQVSNDVDVVINNSPAPQISNEELVIPAFALSTVPAIVVVFRCVGDPGEGRRTRRPRGAGH